MVDGNALLKELRRAKTARVSVYLNVKRIDELFRQRVARINSIITSEELGADFSSTLAGILGIKASGKKGLSAEYEIAPADKALLIEIAERRAGSLYAVDDNTALGAVISFFGQSRIATDTLDVTPETTILPADIAAVAQERRIAQAKGSNLGTIVWTSKSKKHLAAIAYMESVVDIGHIYSYPEGDYGILGRKESESSNLLFLSPIWVWYEQIDPSP